MPLVFIPGQGGGYGQSRAIAAEINRLADNFGKPRMDIFAIHCNEELSALHGGTLMEQAEFLIDCIAFIRELYEEKFGRKCSVIAVGHSMGGVVISIAMTLESYEPHSIKSIINLSSPLLAPPVPIQRELVEIYSLVNDHWKRKFSAIDEEFKSLVVLSVAAGNRDTILNSELCQLESIVPPSNGLFLFASSVPFAWTSTDHNSIVWSYSFIRAIASCIVDGIDVATGQLLSTEKVIEIYRNRLISPFITGKSVKLFKEPEIEEIYMPFPIENMKRNFDILPSFNLIDLRDEKQLQILSNLKFGQQMQFLFVNQTANPQVFKVVERAALEPSFHLPYLTTDIKFVIDKKSRRTSIVTAWHYDLSKINAQYLLLATRNSSRPEEKDQIWKQMPKIEFLQPAMADEYFEKDFAFDFYDEESKKTIHEHRKNSEFLSLSFTPKKTHVFNHVYGDLLFSPIELWLPQHGAVLHEFIFPQIADGLSSLHVEISGDKDDFKFLPVCRLFCSSIGEEKFYAGQWSFSISFHDHYSSTTASELTYPLEFAGVSNTNSGFILNCWLNPKYSYKISFHASLQVLLGQVCRKYGIGFIVFPFAIILLSFSSSLLRPAFPILLNSLIAEMHMSYRWIIATMIISIAKWNFSSSSNNVFFGNEHFLVVPMMLAVGYGVAMAIILIVNICVKVVALFAACLTSSTSHRNDQARLLLMLFVSFALPYQYGFMMMFLMLGASVVKTKVRLLRLDGSEKSEDKFNYQISLLTLMFIPLCVHIASLIVWMRNLMAGWWSFSDYNGFSLLPFGAVVLFSSHKVPKFTRLTFYCCIALFLYCLLYANLAVYLIDDICRILHLLIIFASVK